jgi:hypothetical protein
MVEDLKMRWRLGINANAPIPQQTASNLSCRRDMNPWRGSSQTSVADEILNTCPTRSHLLIVVRGPSQIASHSTIRLQGAAHLRHRLTVDGLNRPHPYASRSVTPPHLLRPRPQIPETWASAPSLSSLRRASSCT